MDLGNYKKVLENRAKTSKPKGINSLLQEVTWEVCQYVKEPKNFGFWLGIVKRFGPGQMRNLIKQLKEKGITNAKYVAGCTKTR